MESNRNESERPNLSLSPETVIPSKDEREVEREEKESIQSSIPLKKKVRRREEEASYSRAKKTLLTILALALFVVLWEISSLAINNSFLLPTPVESVQALVLMFQGHIPRGAAGVSNIYSGISSTLILIGEGYAISLVGVPVGFLMGRWKAAEAIADPWINAFYAIPMVAIAPLIYIAVGGNDASDLVIVVLMTVFMITLNTFQGVRYVSNSLVEVGRSLGTSEAQLTRYIVLPAALPDTYAGLRIGLGRAVLGAIIAQAILSQNGLGYMMLAFVSISQTAYMVATIMLIALIGFAFLNLPRIGEKWLFQWKEGERLSRT
jgi:ABC-type nitrate/sulfonate/bicarbonate transport system permease component